VTTPWSANEDLLRTIRSILTDTMRYVHSIRTGRSVILDDHFGDPAREADLLAGEVMKALVEERLNGLEFSSEDIGLAKLDSRTPVWLADPIDGTRQHADLGFGFGCGGSIHVWDSGWQLAAAGIVNSSMQFAGMAFGVTSDLLTDHGPPDLPSIIVSASRPRRIEVLTRLAKLLDPERGRVWNSAGNPVLPNFLRSSNSVLVQLSATAIWDSMFAPIAFNAGFDVRRLDAQSLSSSAVTALDIQEWFGDPFQRNRVVPPLAIGRPGSDLLRSVWNELSANTID
jgi:Inositol monophosphatase family